MDCGAFTDGGEWFQFRWPAEWEGVHINSKELLPIVAVYMGKLVAGIHSSLAVRQRRGGGHSPVRLVERPV